MTFDVGQEQWVGVQYRWQRWWEVFCVCRNCHRPTLFVVSRKDLVDDDPMNEPAGLAAVKGSLNDYVRVERYVSLRDEASVQPPEHVPAEIQAAFTEGATCLAVDCWNAAGAMFRMCIDLVTRPMLPKEEVPGLNAKTRRDLGLRLPWLFANGVLPSDLRHLSTCIREDGNDGVHAGTLKKEDAEDLLDFTTSLLERVYTEPEKLKFAEQRRKDRRAPK